ncbi:MAG: hypothetical protein ACO20V_14120, partial [Alphaproteobacteria bacterium]
VLNGWVADIQSENGSGQKYILHDFPLPINKDNRACSATNPSLKTIRTDQRNSKLPARRR